MIYIKTFEKFKLDYDKQPEHKPFDGDCGVTIKNKNYDFNVGEIIEYVRNNYKQTNIDINKVKRLSLFSSIDNVDIDKIDLDNVLNDDLIVDDKSYDKLSKEQKKEWVQKQLDIILKSNLIYPIIVVADDSNNIIHIIDGNHRVQKAIILNKKTIKAYIIPVKDLKDIDCVKITNT